MFDVLEARGVSARTGSVSIGICNSGLSQWKAGVGKPTLRAVAAFSKVYNVPLDYLIFGRGPKLTQARNITELDFLGMYDDLTPEAQKMVRAYTEGLHNGKGKRADG